MKERPINPLRIWAISHNVVFIYHVFGLSFVVAKGNFTEELVGILALALALALALIKVVGPPNVVVIGRGLWQRREYGARIGERGKEGISEVSMVLVPHLYDSLYITNVFSLLIHHGISYIPLRCIQMRKLRFMDPFSSLLVDGSSYY